MNTRITFWSGVGTVTGANFLLEVDDKKILVDCGLLQGTGNDEKENAQKFPYNPKVIDMLFITHSHMDHIGKVPKLVKDGFKGVIYSTPETFELAKIMLADALKVMKSNSEENGGAKLYNDEDLSKAISLWQTIPYHTEKKLADDLSVYVKDAGHILGSAMYEFKYKSENSERRILFTGDSGNSPAPLLKDTDSIAGVDYLVMDSVYGERNHEPKENRDEKFRQVILDTIKSGGALVIPAFSLERTQVILYELNNLVEEGKIPSIPVFLDSPLGIKVTEVYSKLWKDFKESVQAEIKSGDDIFDFPKLHITKNSFESKEIFNTPNPKIIIAGSGMSVGGRVLGHEINYLPDPKSTILLVGYQALGTLGREIQERPESVEINGGLVPIKAKVEMISGYSSHKDSDGLLEMAGEAKETLKKVFVTMGEPKASTFLVQRLKDYLEIDAVYPERGKVYELD